MTAEVSAPAPPDTTNECSVMDCHREAERIKKVVGYIPLPGNQTREEEVYVVVCLPHFDGLEHNGHD